MNDTLQRIDQVFIKHKLLGNHDFAEDEYSLMMDYVGTLYNNFDKNSYKLIFVTLVEIAKRWKQFDSTENDEENSGYWDYVFKTLFGSDINHQLCHQYRNVIGWLGKNSNIPVVTGGHSYYATIMMHSFAPKNSIHSFFDLCYIIFKKDLDFGFTSDDEWLCEIVAAEMKSVLGGGYREDKKVSIGSSAYSIKIGLRSFSLNEDLSVDFVKFIKQTFYQINKLFNGEKIKENTRLERCIVEWWKNKKGSEKLSNETAQKKRVPTVSKQNIVAKYIRDGSEVFLCIPSIRLDDDNNVMQLLVYVDEEQVYFELMRTKRGELVIATKPKEFELNELLKRYDSINVRIEITENDVVIFNSENNKATSLSREFILFDGEKEVFSQINKPTNYFVYSKEVDALKKIPRELTTCGTNLYNIYPSAGESLIGEIKQIFFVNKEKEARLGNEPCLIGNLTDVEWVLDEFSCVVYGNSVKLLVPKNTNLKALELRIDRNSYKLQNLSYERLENKSYQFGLNALGLISECEPTEILLYSYENEMILLSETIIVYPNLEVRFNNAVYYGDIERKVIITNANESKELTWSNQDKEVFYPLNDGVLLIKIPYFRWRINNAEWHNETINGKLWYKDLLENGDLLEVDNPKENEEISIFENVEGRLVEIIKTQKGKFEIGRAIYANESKEVISILFSNGKEKFELFKVATKEHFIESPLIYKNSKVYWDVENTFIGDKSNEFLINAKAAGENGIKGKKKVGATNIEFQNFDDNFYKIEVRIKDKNIFSNKEKYDIIYEGNLIVGNPDKFRFKNKRLCIKEVIVASSEGENNNWMRPYSTYIIQDLQYLENIDEGQTSLCYIGKLGVLKDNKIIHLNYMENERGEKDKINPVRLELRSNNSFWLGIDYVKENSNNLETLIFDNTRRGLCNTNSHDRARYKVVNLFKFKEEEDV